MGKLTDILREGDADRLRHQWAETEAADEFSPLPAGEYVAHIVAGEFTSSRAKGTPSYKLSFKVVKGEHTNRRFWHDCWLTEAALPSTKRDLLKLGVQSLDQLENPLPKYMRCKVKLTKRRDDNGNEYNRVRSFEVLGIDPQETDAFSLSDENAEVETEGELSDGDPTETFPHDEQANQFLGREYRKGFELPQV